MEVSCTSCPARFAIPDAKIRGRKVRISCKRCGAPIVVDGTSLAEGAAKPEPEAPKPAAAAPKPAAAAPKPAAAAPKPAAAAPKPAAAAPKPAAATPKPAVAAPKPAAPKPAPATPKPAAATPKPPVAAPKPAAAAPKPPPAAPKPEPKSGWREPAASSPGVGPRPAAGPPRPGAAAPAPGQKPYAPKRTMLGVAPPQAAPPPPPPPPEENDDEPEWTVALTDEHHEEMRTAEVIELYFRGSIDHETFIWTDGMEDWKRPWEIPMIAAELSGRGLSPPSGDEPDIDDLADAEPDHDEATIVASVRFAMPSSRGAAPASARSPQVAPPPPSVPRPPQSSGVWREPGRADTDDAEIGFDDATVTVDSLRAQKILAGAKAASAAEESPPPPSFNDVPTTVESDVEAPPASGLGSDVDDLLSDMEPTMAMEDAFRAESRPLAASIGHVEEEERTRQQQASGGGFGAVPTPFEPKLPEPDGNLFDGFDFAMPSARSQPLDSLIEPTLQQQAPAAGAQPLFAEPMQAPLDLAPPPPAALQAPPQKKSRALGCFLTLVVLVLLLGAAAGASWYLKQPASLYGPDGRPKLPMSL
jgi:predicted Zn finger-like uncharacterized protein